MNTRLPTFFVAGVPKAGTTALYHYLAQHPQIYLSPIKEPTYFAAADLLTSERFRRRQARERPELQAYLAGPQPQGAGLYVTEWSDYVQLFRDVRDERAIGEASTGYFWMPSAAGAIRARLPAAKLVFILRDPAERLFSWYLLSLEKNPQRTFREWYEADQHPPDDWWSAADAGRYATHLQRFRDNFPADQLRIYLAEDLRRDIRSVLRDVFAFLGVDPEVPVDTTERHNETFVPRFPTLHRLRRWLAGTRSVAPWLPASVRDLLRRSYHRGRGAFTLDPGDRQVIVEQHRDEILRTADLIGRDLSAWLR